MCPHHIFTAFMVHAHTLGIEEDYVSYRIITAFIVHAHALEAEGAYVSTPYQYSLHCSRTRFRSRGSLCVHTISLQPSLFAHTLQKPREHVCPHHIITACIVRAHALEAEGACVSTPYHYSLHCSRTRFRSRGNLCFNAISLEPSLFTHTL